MARKLNFKNILSVIVGIILLFILGYIIHTHPRVSTEIPSTSSTSGLSLPVFDQRVSDGTITISYPSSEFGLALTNEQILVRSYIPACDSDFDYCIYYNGSAYAGTNFESAGIRVKKRDDLATQTQCLNAQPSGYTNMTPTISTSENYSISVFAPLGDGAAGHYAKSALYRLAYKDSCYELETRIGQSQFQNYPAGSIKEFTSEDQVALEMRLATILNSITLLSGEKVSF